jgi:hypothetical protein
LVTRHFPHHFQRKPAVSEYAITAGDVVKLAQPYRPEDWATQQPMDWPGFEYGLVAEFDDDEHVSLFLYDRDGQLFVRQQTPTRPLVVPTMVDFSFDQLERYESLVSTGNFWACKSGYWTIKSTSSGPRCRVPKVMGAFTRR